MDQAWGDYLGTHWLTVSEVCRRSRLSRATVYRAMAAGCLEYTQHQRGRRIEEGEFGLWMQGGFPTAAPHAVPRHPGGSQ